MRQIEDTLERLPVPAEDKVPEQMSLPELLQANVKQGLLQSLRILNQPLKEKAHPEDELSVADIRAQRIVVDTTASLSRLLAGIQVTDLQASNRDHGQERLRAAVEAFRAEQEAEEAGRKG